MLTVLTVLIELVVVMMVNMKLLMLIRVGSEAMIGYSPSVRARDPGTEKIQSGTDRGTEGSQQPSKEPTLPSAHQNTHNINPESKYSKPRNILFVDITQYIIF